MADLWTPQAIDSALDGEGETAQASQASQAKTQTSLARGLSDRHRVLAYLLACGMQPVEISRRMGVTQAWISTLRKMPEVRREIESVQKSVFAHDLKKGLASLLPKAQEVVAEVLGNPNEKSRLRVETAFRVMERTHGKATQPHEVGGSMLRDLFDLLDARAKGQPVEDVPIDVTAESVDLENYGETKSGGEGEGEGTSGEGAEGS